jgi:hypothetical protein
MGVGPSRIKRIGSLIGLNKKSYIRQLIILVNIFSEEVTKNNNLLIKSSSGDTFHLRVYYVMHDICLTHKG